MQGTYGLTARSTALATGSKATGESLIGGLLDVIAMERRYGDAAMVCSNSYQPRPAHIHNPS
jgi:hypothetical protein